MPTLTVPFRKFYDSSIPGRRKEVGKGTMEKTMDLVDFSNILYADDTFLAGKHSREPRKSRTQSKNIHLGTE